MPKFKPIPPELRVNKKIAQKVVELMQYGIPAGKGTPEKGKMCIEHIISYVYGVPNNFHPKCVGEKVNQSEIDLNDCNWSSNKARAEGMAKIGIAQLGSVNIDQNEYEKELQIELNKIILPFLMENQENKDEFILKQIERFKLATTDEEREKIRVENYNNYYYYYYYYYYNYYNNYYYYNYYNYNYNYNGDKFLRLVSDCILNALITLKSPGCKYLYLVENFKAYDL